MNSAGFSIIWLAFIVGVFYLMIIRPQRKRMASHRQLLGSLKTGDEAVLTSGIYGTVRAIRDEDLDIEIAKGTVVRVTRGAISGKVTEPVLDITNADGATKKATESLKKGEESLTES